MTELSGLGHLKDAVDLRDKAHQFDLLGLSTSALPDRALDMSAFYTQLNQRNTNACTGFASKQAVRIWQLANIGGVVIDPSALGNYYNGRAFHQGLKDVDSGGYIRSVFRGLNAYGVMSEEDFPFDASMTTTAPPLAATLRAYKHRQARYRRFFATGDRLHDQLRAAIASKRPIVCGIPVHESFMSSRGPERIEAPVAGDELVGWHAVELHAYEKVDGRLWYDLGNSWGAWRRDGRAWLSADYIARGVDFWSIEMVDTE